MVTFSFRCSVVRSLRFVCFCCVVIMVVFVFVLLSLLAIKNDQNYERKSEGEPDVGSSVIFCRAARGPAHPRTIESEQNIILQLFYG